MAERRHSNPVPPGSRRLGEAVGRVYHVLVRGFELYIDMPVPQYCILFALVDGDESQATLVRELEIDKATLTRHLKRLEAEGHVACRADPVDNRFTLVSLTDGLQG